MGNRSRFVTLKGKVIYSFGFTNNNIYCTKWGQQLGEIDGANYYTPSKRCSGRWNTIEEYQACKDERTRVA